MRKKVLISSIIFAIAIFLIVGIYFTTKSKAERTLNREEVASLIASQYPGTISRLAFDNSSTEAVYEIDIKHEEVEYKLVVDAYSGAIKKLVEKRTAETKQTTSKEPSDESLIKKDKLKKEDESIRQEENKMTVLDEQNAIEIALEEFPGTVEDIELEEEDGRLVYEVEIEQGESEAEFHIDAMTGEILYIKMDD